MPRITIELSDADITALVAGKGITIGTKPKKKAPVVHQDAATTERQHLVIDTWREWDAGVSVGRLWKALREVKSVSDETLVCAIRLALDWNAGRAYSPEWFVRDIAEWVERASISEWTLELGRTKYRKSAGLDK